MKTCDLSLKMIGWLTAIAMILPCLASAQDAPAPMLTLVSPVPGTTAVSKSPLIAVRSTVTLLAEGRLVLLDGNDISALVTEENGLYSFTPLNPLPAGEHSLYIGAYLENGSVMEKEFFFSSRQSEAFEEIYSNNRLSAALKTALERKHSPPPADQDSYSSTSSAPGFSYTVLDSYLSSESMLKEGRWDTSLTTNLRYLDQSAAVLEPEKKGLSLIDFLISSSYTGDSFSALVEIGDTSIEESANTIDYLSRRGGKAQLKMANLTLTGFGVLGEETLYEIDGLGLGFNSTDHIMGTSLQADFFDRKVSVKAIYSRGGQEGDSYGTWSDGGARKGDVAGVVLTTDFFDQLLVTDFEIDTVNYDHNTGDDSDDVNDKAYRIGFSGLKDVYDYALSYKYTGPEYDVVGNQSIIKDWAGIEFLGGASYTNHAVRLLGNYSWDNVEDKSILARIYSLTAGVDYQYLGWQRFPIGLTIENNSQRSKDEPEETDPTSLDTGTLTASVGYLDGPWSVDVRSSYSEQNDRTENDYDSKIITVAVSPTYTQARFSIMPSWMFNSSKDISSDVRTDTNTITLDVYTNLYKESISGEFGGTYDWTSSDDDSIKMNNTALYARLNYRFEQLWRLEGSTIALEYLYNRQEDEIYETTTWEGVLTLVLSSSLPYSL